MRPSKISSRQKQCHLQNHVSSHYKFRKRHKNSGQYPTHPDELPGCPFPIFRSISLPQKRMMYDMPRSILQPVAFPEKYRNFGYRKQPCPDEPESFISLSGHTRSCHEKRFFHPCSVPTFQVRMKLICPCIFSVGFSLNWDFTKRNNLPIM